VASLALWQLGYPDQALRKEHEALTLAQELSHPFTLAFALNYAAIVLPQVRREVQLAKERIGALMALSSEYKFPFGPEGTILQGWLLTEGGKEEEGITQMRHGLAAYRARGAGLRRSYFLALLVEAYGKAGQIEEGLSVSAEALAGVDKTGEHFYEAELYRLKGQLTLQQSQVLSPRPQAPSTQYLTPSTPAEAEAEACFLKAIEIARKQQGKSLEL
jgi:predicted ATPase